MQKYINRSGSSSIVGYQLGADHVIVQFNSGRIYTYDYVTTGAQNVEVMKALALKGEGLYSFIHTNVKNKYSSKRWNISAERLSLLPKAKTRQPGLTK